MRLRRKPRLVRVHHEKLNESFEGVWIGTVSGHYRIKASSMIGHADGKPILLGEILIPKKKVAFLQVIAEDER